MPDRLSDQVPEFDAATEAAQTTGLSAIEFVPVVGGALATAVGGALAMQSQRRNLELFRAIAEVVDGLTDQIDGLTLEAITSDPRFLAAAEKVARAAQQTADEPHRARLLRALRHAGAWSQQEPHSTDRMTDLLARFGPLHIVVSRFFADPGKWLRENTTGALVVENATVFTVTLLEVLREDVFRGAGVPDDEIGRVVEDLQREGVMVGTLDRGHLLITSDMVPTEIQEQRLTEFGHAFLAFAEGELDP